MDETIPLHIDRQEMTKTRRTAWKSDDHHDNAPINVVMPDVGHICGHWGIWLFPACVQALTERHSLSNVSPRAFVGSQKLLSKQRVAADTVSARARARTR